MSQINPRASVSQTAIIGNGARIGAFAVVGDEVELGDDCLVEPHAVIYGPARIGRQNHFYSFSAVGGEPQDLTYSGERVSLEVGDANQFREFVTVSRGTKKGAAPRASAATTCSWPTPTSRTIATWATAPFL